MSPPPAIFWLTRDFRFADNAALAAATRGSMRGPVLPVFFIDRLLRAQGAASRWRLERGLRAFDAELRRRANPSLGQGILILRGEPDRLLPGLAASLGATEVHQSDWPAPEMRALQARVAEALQADGRRLVLHPGHLLIHPHLVRTTSGGSYRVYTPFARALRGIGPDRPGASAPDRITLAASTTTGLALKDLNLAPELHGGRAVLDRHALPAGEAAALARLDAFLDRAGDYETRRDRADLEVTSGLSEHLALGEISPRSVWALAMARAQGTPADRAGVEKFLSELIWREFAWHLLIGFPQMATAPWRPEWRDFPWQGDSVQAEAWRRAETGIPLVDAGLREMRVTGRMHNRVRMVVASWLTKHLLSDWRLGLAHFADSLSDWDPAANAMNWQWVAGCGPDASPFFRIFNPETQAERFDPAGRYRQMWLETQAADYRATLPCNQTALAPARVTLEDGRRRALDAYAGFRRATQSEAESEAASEE